MAKRLSTGVHLLNRSCMTPNLLAAKLPLPDEKCSTPFSTSLATGAHGEICLAISRLTARFPTIITRGGASGLWQTINDVRLPQLRLAEGRQAQPNAGSLDSQSVTTTEIASERGCDVGKQVKGRKRQAQQQQKLRQQPCSILKAHSALAA
jgi:hypothetical protein